MFPAWVPLRNWQLSQWSHRLLLSPVLQSCSCSDCSLLTLALFTSALTSSTTTDGCSLLLKPTLLLFSTTRLVPTIAAAVAIWAQCSPQLLLSHHYKAPSEQCSTMLSQPWTSYCSSLIFGQCPLLSRQKNQVVTLGLFFAGSGIQGLLITLLFGLVHHNSEFDLYLYVSQVQSRNALFSNISATC